MNVIAVSCYLAFFMLYGLVGSLSQINFYHITIYLDFYSKKTTLESVLFPQ